MKGAFESVVETSVEMESSVAVTGDRRVIKSRGGFLKGNNEQALEVREGVGS